MLLTRRTTQVGLNSLSHSSYFEKMILRLRKLNTLYKVMLRNTEVKVELLSNYKCHALLGKESVLNPWHSPLLASKQATAAHSSRSQVTAENTSSTLSSFPWILTLLAFSCVAQVLRCKFVVIALSYSKPTWSKNCRVHFPKIWTVYSAPSPTSGSVWDIIKIRKQWEIFY